MLKKLLLFGSITFFLTSCIKSPDTSCQLKESTVVAPAGEIATLQSYITANHPMAIQHSSGFFYEITNPGTGTVTPAVCSSIVVKYTGTLTTGFKFDENLTGFSELLGRLVIGWQKGLPLIKAGGSMSLYIPPTLGYGSQDIKNSSGAVIIPANSILIFTIQLVAVQ